MFNIMLKKMEDDFLPRVTFHTRFVRAQMSHEVNNHLPRQYRIVLFHNCLYLHFLKRYRCSIIRYSFTIKNLTFD